MKKTKVVIISAIIIFIVVISVLFVYIGNRKSQMTYEITPDIVSRLQAYPYNFGEPLENCGFNETDKDTDRLEQFLTVILLYMKPHIIRQLFL